MAQAGIGGIIIDVLQNILCIVTGVACPDPCLKLLTYTGAASYKLCRLVDRIGGVLYLMGWSLAIIIILWGGIVIMVSGDNEEQIKKGKKILKNGLIGAAIILCAGFILSLLVSFLYPLFI